MTTKEATMIAGQLEKNLTDKQVREHANFELYTDKERDMVVNAYRQLGTPTAEKATKVVTKAAGKTKTVTKKTAKKAVAKKSEKKPTAKKNTGTDAQLREHIIAGKTNAAALAIVVKKNPGCNTKLASASWNRSQLRNNWKKYGFTKNPNVPTDREAAGK